MKKIFLLESDMATHSFFVPKKNTNSPFSIKIESGSWRWQRPESYSPVNFELQSSDNNRKNFNFDICTFASPFIIFSEKAWSALYDILNPIGIKFDIITQSKRKLFFGYYPLRYIQRGCLDLELSDYSVLPKGLIVREAVLKKSFINADYLFMIEESSSKIFVDEKFKKRVEEAGLIGFDFSYSVQLS